MTELTSIPAHRLARLIALGELSPVDTVDAFLDRAARLSPRLNALSALYADEARAAAIVAQRSIETGSAPGPLHGVPIVLKDSIDIEGKPTTAGSAHFRNRIASRSAQVVDRLRACGAIVIGKTRMVEFGLGAMGLNETFGTPWNPWQMHAHYAPGGSSSGAAVAVAARIAPWALGTDTGGSARIPAAWCGVVGMKPTQGHFSMNGVVPLSPTLDVIGPICRTAEELAYLFHALTHDPRVSTAASTPNAQPGWAGHAAREVRRDGLRGYRLGMLSAGELAGVDSNVLAGYHAALEVFASQGATLVPLALPRPLQEYRVRTSAITFREAYELYGELARDPASKLDSAVRQRLLHAAQYSREDYTATLAARPQLQQECAAVLARVDALLSPTTQNLPPLVSDAARADPPNTFTRFVNFLDLCAVSVPTGLTKEGFPTGLQIICNGHHDTTALEIAIEYQRVTAWHTRIPPL
ncbi:MULTISPECIES: amidase [Paraburkholderia]|uniref:amidase n=1 Tax=Paraburkholderia TaxID=1822464 RepID=UPI0022574637|nr:MULTISPECIES: amidase [Paraburkholderia]MCX4165030.1 amidase [Paraburkholderia megapolitana]MDN7160523.1 amidase [Paraburkholderia sp. CHISQ3]MDQ6497570.1 amidase [Paraburkholderia megapolitana]